MANTKALCVFTNLLGNVVTTRTMMGALERLPAFDPTYVVLSGDDYLTHPAPWWRRLSDPWEAEFIARQKTQTERQQRFDMLWVHGWESAVALQDLAKEIPAVATLDCVPATMDRQIRLREGISWKRVAAHQIHHRAFRAAAPRYEWWLPMATECASSLEQDYGVAPERCTVTLMPLELDWWAPPPRAFVPPWRALFVGNDFKRKGGEFLLRLYTAHLAGKCTLTIVSNDAELAGRELPPGVQWIRGANREQVRDAYWNSHIFLLPTQQDFGPYVVAEALAAGLPPLATDIGGVPDLIQDGESGFILARSSSLEQWAKRIHGLFAAPGELWLMSMRARRFAEQFLGLARLDRLVSSVVDRLRAAA